MLPGKRFKHFEIHPEPYRSLDLLLTAPTNTKNVQQVSGSIEFSTDIYLNDDTIINDRIDGVNLKTLVPKTVFNYGDQEITGLSNFNSVHQE